MQKHAKNAAFFSKKIGSAFSVFTFWQLALGFSSEKVLIENQEPGCWSLNPAALLPVPAAQQCSSSCPRAAAQGAGSAQPFPSAQSWDSELPSDIRHIHSSWLQLHPCELSPSVIWHLPDTAAALNPPWVCSVVSVTSYRHRENIPDIPAD